MRLQTLLTLCALLAAPQAHAESAFTQLKAKAATPGTLAPPPATQLFPRNTKNVLPTDLGANPLIVVHASTEFDEGKTAKAGIDAAVAKAKAAGRKVVYLLHDQAAPAYKDWYPSDRTPDYELFSEGGEHNLSIPGDEITIVGGFFGSYDSGRGCQTLATRDAIRMHFERSDKPFTVHMPLPAIFFYEADSITRAELLDPAALTPAKLKETFKDFPRLFFIVENYSETPEFAHPYFGGEDRQNKSYRPGDGVPLTLYTFHILYDGRSVSSFGTGPRQVRLSLTSR